jgi:hypothetical protein
MQKIWRNGLRSAINRRLLGCRHRRELRGVPCYGICWVEGLGLPTRHQKHGHTHAKKAESHRSPSAENVTTRGAKWGRVSSSARNNTRQIYTKYSCGGREVCARSRNHLRSACHTRSM